MVFISNRKLLGSAYSGHHITLITRKMSKPGMVAIGRNMYLSIAN